MEKVRIVGTEDDVLVLATESGARFALAIDDVLRREVRRATEQESTTPTALINPREIQSHIRAGLTATEVAELLGISEHDVARFEGPVLAEREHVIGQALAVPVLLGSEIEPAAQPTFGAAIRAKLAALGADDERWASWKDDSGWTVKLEFTADEVAHDARWSFDPRASLLAPINADATRLSRQGVSQEGLIPRLRALDADKTSPYKDDTRFDSGAFGPRGGDAEALIENPFVPERANPAVQEAAMNRADDDIAPSAETADLLEALRRRRGQRESAPEIEDESDDELGPIGLFDALDDVDDEEDDESAEDAASGTPEPAARPKRRRGAMPSWDEIVFGARTDD